MENDKKSNAKAKKEDQNDDFHTNGIDDHSSLTNDKKNTDDLKKTKPDQNKKG